MSRSFKHRPFMSICGGGSAKRDKTLAHRGVRRAHKAVLHDALKSEDFDVILPHKYECAWNETYSWGRDGNQIYQGLDGRDWQSYTEADSEADYFGTWPPQWYVQMMRK